MTNYPPYPTDGPVRKGSLYRIRGIIRFGFEYGHLTPMFEGRIADLPRNPGGFGAIDLCVSRMELPPECQTRFEKLAKARGSLAKDYWEVADVGAIIRVESGSNDDPDCHGDHTIVQLVTIHPLSEDTYISLP